MHKHNVIKAVYDSDYKIILEFDDGLKGSVDLNDLLFSNKSGVFKKLQDKNKFQNFKIVNHTLCWGDDIDLAPEYLYDLLAVN